MKLLYKMLLVVLVTVVVFALAGVLATWAPDRKVSDLAPRWAQAPSGFAAVNGMQVHFRDEGPRDDPLPLILLHGTSASLHTWDGWVDALKDKRRVIRFDLPGFGLTGPHAENDYSVEAYVRVVEAVANALGVKSFAVAGNSLGGQIAWATAHALPQRVQRLILIDAAGYPMAPQSIPIGFRIARVPGVRSLAELVLPRGVIESSLRNVYGDPGKVTPALVDRYYELTLREGNRRALAQRFDQMLKADAGQSVAAIRSLKLPTLIIWGGKDRLIPVENAHRFAADVVGSQLVVLDALGHVPQEEDAAGTVQVARKFLDTSL
ncbi:MAG: alpha/beta hydrolase [Burkholderiales bacterium PBB3]|nr:MAG: alpha/beta hydrolase [Burkholderiales bacterium PBB3]